MLISYVSDHQVEVIEILLQVLIQSKLNSTIILISKLNSENLISFGRGLLSWLNLTYSFELEYQTVKLCKQYKSDEVYSHKPVWSMW